jgi:hypothetical protein
MIFGIVHFHRQWKKKSERECKARACKARECKALSHLVWTFFTLAAEMDYSFVKSTMLFQNPRKFLKTFLVSIY